MNRSDFLNVVGAAAASSAGISASPGTSVAGIRVPDSAVARAALQIAHGVEPVPIFNHSMRTFFFAELLAEAKGTKHDSELVFLASILHDLGLTAHYMSSENRFEVDGANAARELLRQHGVADTSIDIVWDAIALHDSGGIARWKRPEVALVNAGVSADFGGSLELLSRDHVIDVLHHAPREGFIDTFLPAVAAVAAKKPFATGNCFVTDVGYRMVPNFHLPNFCDEVKADPFASYA